MRRRSELADHPDAEQSRPPAPQNPVLRLQGEIGNAAVSRMLARAPATKTGGDITGMQKARERALAHYEKREWV
jgi:hypothetical protein